ncbi:MAG: ATP-dependent DNA helicase RecG, partial [Patescibacteria group bacterium]
MPRSDLKLSSLITEVPRVGPAKAKFLKKLGITHVRDILYTFPRRYDDFSRVTPIAELKVGEKMTVKGKVKKVESKWGFYGRRRLLRIFVDVEDDTGVLHITWFNLRFLPKQLPVEREILVAGEVEEYRPHPPRHESASPSQGEAPLLTKERSANGPGEVHFRMRSPVLEYVHPEEEGGPTHTARITPVYPETYGVTSRFIRYQVKSLLPLIQALPEYIPAEILERHHLPGIREAIRATHFPENQEELEPAQRRLRFDELFFLQLAALVRRRLIQQEPAYPIPIEKLSIDRFMERLPFKLTNAQQGALKEILADLKKPVPMNRLLQGDVGSGKSALALIATQVVVAAGYKALYLAPTEILARQQAEVFSKALLPLTKGESRGNRGEGVELLIGALPPSEKQRIKKRLLSEESLCVVGTHALLQEDVHTHRVALAIVDEQHRFGVEQRKALQHANEGEVPHLLSMTATPIPRTLNLTVYGDLDVSVLNELPAGRKPIQTRIVAPENRDEAAIHTLEQLHAGRQAYVIAPRIAESDPTSLKLRGAGKLEVKSATQTFEEMKHLFPGIAVGLVHGQMKSEEKERVMRHFGAGAIQLLVSTAVVEVGVNVPNATVMIIEGAERFGLAQLHQLRGRVGRAEH